MTAPYDQLLSSLLIHTSIVGRSALVILLGLIILKHCVIPKANTSCDRCVFNG